MNTTAALRIFVGHHTGQTWVDAHRGPGPYNTAELAAAALPRNPDDPRLRIRLYAAGLVADGVWLDVTDPDTPRLAELAALVHSAGVDLAEAHGVPWLIEVFQPSAPADEAYLRTGPDMAGMVAPVPLMLADGSVN